MKKISIFLIIFMLFILSFSFSQNLIVYQRNFAVVSLEKEVKLTKGVNFIALDEVPQSVGAGNFFIYSSKGNRILEVLYPPSGIFIYSSEDMIDTLKIVYILPNINWNAVHSFFIDKDKLRFSSDIYLQNKSDMSFQKIKLSVLAGEINIERGPQEMLQEKGLSVLAMRVPSETELKEVEGYKLFDLSGEYSLAKGGTKIIPIIDAEINNAIKRYAFQNGKVYILWNIENKKENGLGIPIPMGSLKIFEMVGNKVIFLGESSIPNIAVGEKIEVIQGIDFDIKGERKVLESKQRVEGKYEIKEAKVSVEIRNSKKEDVTVEVKEYIYEDSVEIVSSNFSYEKIDKNTFVFYVKVKGESSATLIYNYTSKRLR
uniref:DUF4139 domain-containing protein n=1 Tax=Dictyoglomus thermophilum TaxID=14 RepID=A0A7C3MGM4_DICTH